jgi:hypothetical protein
MSVDDVILWHGTLQALKDDQKKDFININTRVEKTYSAGTYEKAVRKFKTALTRMGATGAYYFDHSIPGQNLHYFKGYPVKENNKNRKQ